MTKLCYQSSGQNDTFDEHLPGFSEYIMSCQEMIAKTRVDITPENAAKVVEANAPYQWSPHRGAGKHGVLLVHGLLDSPFATRDLGKFFQQQGFLVRSVLLPGHGTRPGDLLHVDRHAWTAAIHKNIQWLQTQVEQITYVGISTGATLGIYHALMHPIIARLILFVPAIRIKNPFAPIAQYHRVLSKLGSLGCWVSRRVENNYCRYHSLTLNAVAQVYLLTQWLTNKNISSKLQQPTLAFVSEDDEVVSTDAAITYLLQQPNPNNHIVNYATQVPAVAHPQIDYRNSAFPEKNILNYPHTGLTTAPNNPFFGEGSNYHDFLHYPSKILARLQQSAPPVHYGALTPKNLKYPLLARLSYNPDFAYVLAKIQTFLAHTET